MGNSSLVMVDNNAQISVMTVWKSEFVNLLVLKMECFSVINFQSNSKTKCLKLLTEHNSSV